MKVCNFVYMYIHICDARYINIGANFCWISKHAMPMLTS